MTRLLLLLLIAYLVKLGIDNLLGRFRSLESGAPRRTVAPPGTSAPTHPVEVLERCAACGVYISRQRAVPGPAGALFCSDDCRRRAAQSA
jgi:hypothetical protein